MSCRFSQHNCNKKKEPSSVAAQVVEKMALEARAALHRAGMLAATGDGR
jgi:hypothetical protein